MNRLHLALAGLALALLSSFASAQETIADILSDPALNIDRPADRATAVQRIRAIEMANRDRAHAKARAMGVPIRRVLPDGTVTEIMDLDENGEFLINRTRNANAAISSAANLVYPAPYNLDGTGITVGVWDESAVSVSHTEFLNQAGTASRVTVRDGAITLSSHATHVAGTVNARGASATAKGMAPNALVDSYNWTSDDSEMTAAGATSPQQAGKLTISNHSYGFGIGWERNSSNQWQWYGTGTDQNAYAIQFGQYTSKARSWDIIAYNAPYYLIFHSAGNDNTNNPSNGNQVSIGGNMVTYDSSIHPKGDGLYRNTTTNILNGYENLGHQATSKNIMVIGAANDAVTNGLRDPSKSTLTNFSSKGPTDDGRIKPDIVANGASLWSTEVGSDTAYGNKSGTSMSGPSAAGSAALLVQLYRDRFPGSDMRASMLKGLILHTATDIGNPGPDYHYGWGLMNTKAAAHVIIDHHANPSKNRMIESQLNTSNAPQIHTFTWDGVSPIRATLCWTDPAATTISAHDSRDSRLVNDLDLKIIAPDGTQHYPFVMPFVGTWTVASMSAHATTGINSTDNVEQVLIQNPGQSGTWQVVIDHKGNLTNNQQIYSLVTSGLSAAPLSMEVARDGSAIGVGTADGVSGTAVGSGTQLTYTISNVGGGQLELTTPVTISGQQNCSVTINTQPASPLNGGDSTDLVATVTPAAGGTWSFNISIANNDPEKSPYHWFVTGIAGSSGAVSFTPVADTYIYDQSIGTNYGTEPQMNLNNRTNGNPASLAVLRGLLRFDLSSIPPGTSIESASLDFVQDNSNSGSVDVVEATASWGETTATWTNSNGIYGPTSYGSANTGATAGAAVPKISLNAAGLTKVQSWVNNPAGNHGFGIITANNGNGQANWLALRSRNHATAASHPRLTLTYGGGGGPVEAPLMIVSGNDGVISNGGSDSITETQAAVGTQLTYPIQNLGTANLTLTTPVTATAVSNCTITVNTQPSGTVAASGSTNLVLTVTPSSAGSWSATVSITNNDADKNPYSWTISGTASKTQASLVLNGLAQTYDGTPRVVTATTTPPGVSYSVTYNGLSQPPVNAGNYEVVATVTDPDFEGSTTGTLEVSKATQTIAFAPLDSVSIEDGSFALTATSSSGLPVTYTSSNPPVASISGNTVTPITIGTTTITAIQSGNGNFEPAQNVPQILNVVADGQIALGGEVAFVDGYYIHTFTQNGTFELLGESAINVEVLLVGGGGGGGSSTAFGTAGAGGGGAGGLIYRQAFEVSGSQSVVVGAPGARGGNGNLPGNNGGDSIFGSLVALGGGGGSGGNMQGLAGGSGGGSRGDANGGAGQQPASTSGGFGNAGGGWTSAGGHSAGGGGGAGEAAPSSPPQDPTVGGPGGLGQPYEISGTLAFYAGGGGGGASGTGIIGTGGNGGGGNGANNDTPATPGAPNTGGGGGGGNNNRVGADGGSGIVIVRYPGNPGAVTYTVTYQGNGNTGGAAPASQSKEQDEDLTLSGQGDLVRVGYSFTGWNTAANGNGTSYAAGATYTANESVTLFAQWSPNTYTVTFNPNGGGTPDPQAKQVTFDAAYGTLAIVSRPGHSFDGWFTAASGGTKITDATTVSTAADHTLYAQWTLIPVSVITSASTVHIPEGGTASFQVKLSDQPAENVTVIVSRSSGDTDITVQSGGSLNFTTANWDTHQTVTLAAVIDADAANGTAIITCTPSDPAYQAADVTAIEIDKDTLLTVTSDGNGTTDPSGTLVVEKGAATAILANPNVSHNFVNWTVTSGSATLADAASASTTVTLGESATVKANFAIKQYTLSYSAPSGGSIFGDSPQIVDHGADGTQVTAVPSPGYSFVKWSDDVQTESRTDTAVTSDLTVSAEFSANTYTVTFNANGGAATVPATMEVTFDSAYGTLPSSERAGHTFDGWFTEIEGGDQVTAETLVAIDANHMLYAQWTPDTYVVTYDGNGNTSGTAPADQEKIHGLDLILATNSGNLVKTGFSFAGWNTAADGTGTNYPTAGTYTDNAPLTLYAQWSPGADGTWLPTTAGPFNWGDSANWVNGIVASGTDRTALFTPNITANQVANLDAPRSIGNITFTDSTNSSHNLTISGANALTLSRSSGTPVIDVTQSGRTLTIASQIAGIDGLGKTGPGNLTLSGENTFTGDFTYGGGGTLTTTAASNLGSGGALIFNGDSIWSMGGSIVSYDRAVNYSAGSETRHTSGNASKTITGVVSGSGTAFYDHTTSFIWPNTANTFTGNIIARTGNNVLTYGFEVASLPDASGVGSLTLGTSSGGGTFRWTGTGGDKTFEHRQFILGGTIHGGVIQNLSSDGSKLIIERDLGISGVGNKLLNLAGTVAGNVFAGDIADATGSVISLQLSQNGSWALGGTNTYSGRTTMGFSNPASPGLTFQGMQALSPNTELYQFHSGGSGGHGPFRFLDDSATPVSRSTVNLRFDHRNNSQNNFTVFVGNNGSANGGSGAGGTTGSTIQLGDMNFVQDADGQTAGTRLLVNGANDYKLQLGNVNVNLRTAFAGAWNAQLTANAPLIVGGNVQQAAGSPGTATLQLAGTASGSGILGSVMDSADGTPKALAISKLEAGTWTLSGDNTYTGPTTISVGKLFINGDQSTATGDVSVAANATLGGTGTLGGNTTIANNGRLEFDLSTPAASHDALDLASGKSLHFSGASVLTITSSGGASPGTYTLVTAPGGISGSTPVPATVNLPENWEATAEISGNSLVLIVTSTGSGPGPVESFTITGVPTQTTAGVAITGITITALDELGATATSFNGAVTYGGTAGITGTSANFTDGVLSGVSITPAVLGSDLTFTVDDGDGHVGLAAFTVVSSAYQTWAAENGLTGGNADPDAVLQGDNLTNLQKFAFGMDPNVPGTGAVDFVENGAVTGGTPTVWLRDAENNSVDYRAVFSRRKDHAAAGLRYSVQFSANLDAWVTRNVIPTVISDPGLDGDVEAVSIPYPMSIQTPEGFQKPKFFRVGVDFLND